MKITRRIILSILIGGASLESTSVVSLVPVDASPSVLSSYPTRRTTHTTTATGINANGAAAFVSQHLPRRRRTTTTQKRRWITSSQEQQQQRRQQQPNLTMMRMMISPPQFPVLLFSPITTTTIATTAAAAISTAITAVLSSTGTLLNEFYFSYPYLSAFMTCSCKAGVADYIVQKHHQHRHQHHDTVETSQTSDSRNDNMNNTNQIHIGRNIGFIIYGGFYQGLFQQYMYGSIFPKFFEGTAVTTATLSTQHECISSSIVTTILPQLLIDMVVLGPLLCLPISYIVQSICTTSTTATTTNLHSEADMSSRYTESSHSSLTNLGPPWKNQFPGSATSLSSATTSSSSTSSGSVSGGRSHNGLVGYGWNQNNNHYNVLEKYRLPVSFFVTPSYYSQYQHRRHLQFESRVLIPPPTTTSPSSSSSAMLWSIPTIDPYHHRSNDNNNDDDDDWLLPSIVLASYHNFDDSIVVLRHQLLQSSFLVKIWKGIDQYIVDIKDQNILIKYWALWIPIKCITFTIIPNHLRIVFIATISFFWMMILSGATSSSIASSNDDKVEKLLERKKETF